MDFEAGSSREIVSSNFCFRIVEWPGAGRRVFACRSGVGAVSSDEQKESCFGLLL